jgi:uncharacterized cupredoxin-like copper-binding protein
LISIKEINPFSAKTGRIILTAVLAILAMVSLAACGDTVAPVGQSTAVGTATPETSVALEVKSTDTPQGVAPDNSGAAVVTPADAGASTSSNSSASGQGAGGGTEVKATLKEWAIELSQTEVPAGTVRFTVTNEGMMQHNFTVTDSSGQIAATPNFASSQGPQTLEVALKPGTYTVICSLPGHASRGQKAELIVK